MTPKDKAIKYLAEFDGRGRWANESLFLEYAECAIKDKRLKEHCISLWYEFLLGCR